MKTKLLNSDTCKSIFPHVRQFDQYTVHVTHPTFTLFLKFVEHFPSEILEHNGFQLLQFPGLYLYCL